MSTKNLKRTHNRLGKRRAKALSIRERFRRSKLSLLYAAALALPGLGLEAQAQQSPEKAEARIEYNLYQDYQKSYDKRMQVHAPTVWFRAPVDSNIQLEGSYVFDSMSGASPLGLDSLSGASGLGIEDERSAADLKLTRFYEEHSLGLGLSFSTENDYDSKALSVEHKVWSEDKNTTYSLAFSASSDEIGSSNDSTLDESRHTYGIFTGLTQVINPNTIIQSNLSYSSGDGFYSDPYKAYDNRPGSRGQLAWLTRLNQYYQEYDGSLHTDYRFYSDSWGVMSHMFELAWYQEIGRHWIVRPGLRYYTQYGADYFSSEFPPLDTDKFYTSDQRLADFGALTTGVKVIWEPRNDLSLDAKIDFIQQRRSFMLGSSEPNSISPFYAGIFTIGLTKKF